MPEKLTLSRKQAFEVFCRPGEVVEVRILGAYGKNKAWNDFAKGTVSGYFDDHQSFFTSVLEPCPNFTTITARLGNGGHLPFFIDPIFFERNCQWPSGKLQRRSKSGLKFS